MEVEKLSSEKIFCLLKLTICCPLAFLEAFIVWTIDISSLPSPPVPSLGDTRQRETPEDSRLCCSLGPLVSPLASLLSFLHLSVFLCLSYI